MSIPFGAVKKHSQLQYPLWHFITHPQTYYMCLSHYKDDGYTLHI